jgi:hypothetical protein
MSISHFHMKKTKGIHVHFSHSPINHAIIFILNFLPKKILYIERMYCVGVVLLHTQVIYEN